MPCSYEKKERTPKPDKKKVSESQRRKEPHWGNKKSLAFSWDSKGVPQRGKDGIPVYAGT